MKINKKSIGYALIILSLVLAVTTALIKADIDKKDEFLCGAVSNVALPMTECPAHVSYVSWYILASFTICAIIFLLGIVLILIEFKQEPVKIDISKLDEKEKRIYDLLKQKEGSMYQSDIINETQFSKVQVTRILDKMSAKHIIDVKRRGMTNIVVLR